MSSASLPSLVVTPRANPAMSAHASSALVQEALRAVRTVLAAEARPIELALAAVLARGHVLIEDVPGVGKTTLARALAKVLGCSFSRIQFTSDLLPSDVLGVQVLDARTSSFVFRRGPIFAHVVLADEINRASPKTQSAMLEAMADRQVSVDDQTHALAAPFVVLATQNPVEHHGTYPLPESQLDRFMVRLSLGYPTREQERDLLLLHSAGEDRVQRLPSVLDPAAVLVAQSAVEAIALAPAVADYIVALVTGTRTHPDVAIGCSPRGSLSLAALARAWAFLQGRTFVIPDDVKTVTHAALVHRLATLSGGDAGLLAREQAARVVEQLLATTPVPR